MTAALPWASRPVHHFMVRVSRRNTCFSYSTLFELLTLSLEGHVLRARSSPAFNIPHYGRATRQLLAAFVKWIFLSATFRAPNDHHFSSSFFPFFLRQRLPSYVAFSKSS